MQNVKLLFGCTCWKLTLAICTRSATDGGHRSSHCTTLCFITSVKNTMLISELRLSALFACRLSRASVFRSKAEEAMYSTTVSLAFAAALFVSKAQGACTFGKQPSQVLVANDALRIPIAGADPDAECAATAAAFGLTTASTSASFLLVCWLWRVSGSQQQRRLLPSSQSTWMRQSSHRNVART